ncbi:MAG: CRISPR/Cas system-associated endonuclease Cas1 [Chloroflexi bacterium AL-N10]|nr:CRISPR/Cas system-associated endonuclease Cas1 [Chloroflexi bacterium AL-N10]
MSTLYVQEQGATVLKRDQRIVVLKEGQTLASIPVQKRDQVVVMGRGVQLSTALLVDLIQRGIPVTLTNQHGSRHYATLTANPSRFGALRVQQMQFVLVPAQAIILARGLIAAKITNQRTILRATNWATATAASTQLTTLLGQLDQATTLDQLRGYEGAAAAAYFGAWRTALPPAWGFGSRAFYPPPDPVNALLSFGYTLALHDMLTAVQLTGLDPYLGTFHAVEAGRPALALDLIEEFRPILVDRLVLEVLQTNAITRTRFVRPPERPDAVYLDQAGRAVMVDQYEAVMQRPVRLPTGEQTPLRRVMVLQAQAVARVFRGEQPTYVGFMPGSGST